MKVNGWDLLIDYDRAQDIPGNDPWEGEPVPERLHTILARRLARAGYRIEEWEFRTATNGWHVKIRLDPTPAPIEAVALQAICGSDPSRESCNLQRARDVEQWAREVKEEEEKGGTGMGQAAAEFWRTRWNVLYQPNPERKRKP